VAARAAALDPGSKGNEGPRAPGEGTLRRWERTLGAIVRQRCPRCRKGHIFRGAFAMNDPCPACGLLFQREEGYFLGAMYISFAASVVILSALFFTAYALLPGWGSYLVALLTTVLYLPLTPALFRYSRVLWIYLDRLLDPNGALAGSYEKRRVKQLEGREPCWPGSYPGDDLG
jgi:uncharacterized protein (DUF983 family)